MNKWATIPKIKIDLAHTIDENIEKNEEVKKCDQFSLMNSKCDIFSYKNYFFSIIYWHNI